MLTVALIGLVLGYLVLVSFVYLRQGKMLYYPMREIEAAPNQIGLSFQDLMIQTSDGVKINAWYVPARTNRGTVLFSHGNAGNISHRLDSIRIFNSLGLNVLIYDYRGYGRSEGSPDEQGTYRDAEACWEYLVTFLRERPGRIVLFGRSLGSAVAAETALRKQAGLLIIESGFTSVPDMGETLFPHLPVRLISRYHYNTLGKVGRIASPKLVIHSPQDEIVPYEQGRRIFEAAREPKEFLEISGGHNEGFLISGPAYVQGLDRFLTRYLVN